MFCLTEKQCYYINSLLKELEKTDPKKYTELTDYPNVKNDITWFLRQRDRGFVMDITMEQASSIIYELRSALHECHKQTETSAETA